MPIMFGNETKAPLLQNCLIQLTQVCFIYEDFKVFVTRIAKTCKV